MNHSDRLPVLDIWVDPVTRQEAIDRVKEMLEIRDKPRSIFAANPEKNFSVPKDEVLHEAFKNAGLLLPDGIGMVIAAQILYGAKLARIPGSEFIFDICELAARNHHKVYIYGANEEVNHASVEKLREMYPGLDIVGRSNGYIDESERQDLINRINKSEADILFLALGSPKQEKWFAEYKDQLKHVKVCQGIGGTLDTIVGKVKRAPKFWCRMNLEWLYRLICEPSRIKRQRVLPLFAMMVLFKRVKNGFRKLSI